MMSFNTMLPDPLMFIDEEAENIKRWYVIPSIRFIALSYSVSTSLFYDLVLFCEKTPNSFVRSDSTLNCYTAAGRADKCGNALFGDFNIHIFECLMVAIPQAHIFYSNDITHKLLLFAKCFCTKVAAKLIRTVKTIRIAAMAKATPNSPCSFA